MTYYPKLGTVSGGTMRDEDLVDTFAGELSYYMKRMRLTRDQRKRFNMLLTCCRCAANDTAKHICVGELFNALDEIAPPYAYFGAHEGDGACYGFWPILDNDELPKHDSGFNIPRDMWGEDIYVVNDHGNVDCGHVNTRGVFKPYWSAV